MFPVINDKRATPKPRERYPRLLARNRIGLIKKRPDITLIYLLPLLTSPRSPFSRRSVLMEMGNVVIFDDTRDFNKLPEGGIRRELHRAARHLWIHGAAFNLQI